MEWFIIGVTVLVVLALAGMLIWKAKHRPGSVHGDFRFDRIWLPDELRITRSGTYYPRVCRPMSLLKRWSNGKEG